MRKVIGYAAGVTLLALTVLPGKRVEARAPSTSLYAVSVAAIQSAASHWGVSYWWLRRVAQCESSLNPYAYNRWSGATGLFQFMPGTFYAYARLIGEWRSPYNAYASANVAGYMFHRGLSYQWACA